MTNRKELAQAIVETGGYVILDIAGYVIKYTLILIMALFVIGIIGFTAFVYQQQAATEALKTNPIEQQRTQQGNDVLCQTGIPTYAHLCRK